MRIVAVESGTDSLNELATRLEAAYPDAEVERFTDPMLAVKACYARPVDIAVTGYDLKRMDGIAFLKMLRQITPSVIAALIDDGDAHSRDAQNLMFGYLPRPVTANQLKDLAKN